MNPTNRLTFDLARDFKEDVISSLAVDDVVTLQDDLEARAESLKADHELFRRIIDIRFAGMAESAYKGAEKDTGKIAVSIDPRYNLVCSRAKKVEWDQDKLAALWSRIEQSGDAPGLYIQREIATSYRIAEAVYKAWPAEIRAAFLPARTVTAGETKITIQAKKEEK